MNENNLDLTTGSPLAKIIRFSLPLVGGSIFQQLYNFIDTMIVGRLLGIDALAAVGAYYPLSFLVLGFIQGSCVGFSIPLAQSVGANENRNSRQYLGNAIWLCIIIAAILTPVMMIFAGNILAVLNTPHEIMKLATIFTVVSFAGIPANILYNYSANALRAFGDSTRPFYFLIGSLVLNIILALIFIEEFHTGIAGVAFATVISEFVSGLLNIWWMVYSGRFIRISLADTKFSLHHFNRMCIIGFPMGFEYSISAIGAVIMQDAINLLGTAAVAGQSAGEKIRQLFTLPMESVGMAIATYMAQNYGARKIDRIKKGIIQGSLIQLTYSFLAFIVVMIFKKTLIAAVLGTTTGTVYDRADQYLTIISFFFIIHGLLMIFRNTLQGLGHSIYAIFSGFGELIGRSFGGVLSITSMGYIAICYSNQIAWGLSLLYCVLIMWRLFKRDEQLKVNK